MILNSCVSFVILGTFFLVENTDIGNGNAAENSRWASRNYNSNMVLWFRFENMHLTWTWITIKLSFINFENINFERIKFCDFLILRDQVDHFHWPFKSIIININFTWSSFRLNLKTSRIGILKLSLGWFLLQKHVSNVVCVVNKKTRVIHIGFINYTEIVWWNIIFTFWCKSIFTDRNLIFEYTRFWA